jgi:glycosyltransferase involved in cell wall biosynthesis
LKYLSVIIPTYKRKDRLEKTISSFLDSDSEEIEFIFVDNNSKDGTEELIKNYQQNDRRIKYFKNHTNIGANRNIFRGYLESFSDWIMIQADDDYLKKGFLEEVLDLIKNNKDCGLIISAKKNQQLVYDQTTRIKPSPEAFKVAFGSSGVISSLLFNKKHLNSVEWKLDKSIYPQISLATQISLISEIIYMVPKNKPIIGDWGDDILNLERPDDFGVFERIQIVKETSLKLNQKKNQTYFLVTASLFSWTVNTLVKGIFSKSSDLGFKLLKQLFSNKELASSPVFYVLLVKQIIFNSAYKIRIRIQVFFLILGNFILSFFQIKFYRSLFFYFQYLFKGMNGKVL